MRRREQGFSHILLLLVFVGVLAAIGFAGWRVYQLQQVAQGNSQSQSNENAGTTIVSDGSTASSVITSLKQLLASTFTVDNTDSLHVQSTGHVSYGLSTNGPDWYTPGYNFAVYPASGSAISITASDTSDRPAINAALAKQLEADGLHKMPVQVTPAVPYIGLITYYNSDKVVCALEYEADVDTNPISVSCSNVSAYASASKVIKPLADAYYTANPSDVNLKAFQIPTTKNSKTNGYQIGYMNYFPSYPRGVFYAKNNSWAFVPTDDNGLKCDMSLYSSDVHLAFLGETCYGSDPAGKDTVQ